MASVLLLETFFGFVAVVAFFVVAFFEETLAVAVFLTVGFKATFALDFLGAATFLDFSTAPLDVGFALSAADFFIVLAAAFLGLSAVEDGFLVAVVALFLVEAGLF